MGRGFMKQELFSLELPLANQLSGLFEGKKKENWEAIEDFCIHKINYHCLHFTLEPQCGKHV